jgi:hypothetical protein
MSVEICNLALVSFGADRIMDIDEDNESAKRLKAIYIPILKDLLRAHPWNFASRRAGLAQLVETPAFGFSYYYSLPPNCLRAVEVNENPKIDFVVEGRKLLCNEATINLKYIAYVEDSVQYDSNFVALFAARLSAEIAYALTSSRTVTKDRWDIYFAMLKTARSSDGQEGKPQRYESHRWIRSRS